MTDTMEHPTENLVRGYTGPQVVVRADLDPDTGVEGERILTGEFARFNEWTEISSLYEGHFLERIAPGAFDDTLANDLDRVKVLFDHGHDPSLGNKPLGTIRSVEPTDTGVAYEVALIETDYNREFIIPAADAGLLGASFRMRIRAETENRPTEPADHNPMMLPERTIEAIDLYEFGPVTFPAYQGATASMRSRSDEFLSAIVADAPFLARFMERTSMQVGSHVLNQALALGYSADPAGSTHGEQATGRSQQAALLEILTLKRN